MPHVVSKDGTKIAFDKLGEGPALIIVAGAFQDRMAMMAYAQPLSEFFTIYNYDRRGRGESTDTQPYAIEREMEDIDALVQEAGGSAFVFGGSSGGILALDAAEKNPNISKLALYEPPFIVDDTAEPLPRDILARLKQFIADGRPGDAVELFMVEGGAKVPREAVAGMRTQPFWSEMEKAAPTLVYDATLGEGLLYGEPLPTDRWTHVTIPTLVMVGKAQWATNSAKALVELLPNGTLKNLDAGFHEAAPESFAPLLKQFFLG